MASLLADLEGADGKDGDGVATLLAERGVDAVDLEGWQRIDAAEKALGTPAARPHHHPRARRPGHRRSPDPLRITQTRSRFRYAVS